MYIPQLGLIQKQKCLEGQSVSNKIGLPKPNVWAHREAPVTAFCFRGNQQQNWGEKCWRSVLRLIVKSPNAFRQARKISPLLLPNSEILDDAKKLDSFLRGGAVMCIYHIDKSCHLTKCPSHPWLNTCELKTLKEAAFHFFFFFFLSNTFRWCVW